ncbi:MAG: glycosyltransferase family 4 protein [Bacteroidales bacterium]|nr:glycosyltransferase family 4 protein [Bacteroidales bacterium]
MKTLHIIDHMSLGGAQFLIKGVFEKYQNPDLFLFALRKTDLVIEVNHKNVFVSKSKSKYSFHPIKEIKKIIKDNNIQIIHCYLLKSQIFGYILRKFFFPKIKLIFHELGEIFQNDRNIYKKFMKFSESKVDKYVVVSKATKTALVNKTNINGANIEVLDNYIILNDFNRSKIHIDKKQEKKKLNIQENEIVLGYAGRLSKVKGCEHLINAMPFVNKNAKLIIAGTGDEKSKLENLIAQNNAEQKVKLLGFVQNIRQFYMLIDILVIPSEHESFGLIAIEAQALGIPVIASDIPGLNEVVINNKTGLLFERKNSKDLAEKINKLIEDNELKAQLINGGYENVKKYDIDDYYNKMLNVYQNLISNE